MTTAKTNAPTNIRAQQVGARIAVECTMAGARFVVVCDLELRQTSLVVKAPLRGLKPGDAGYFEEKPISESNREGKVALEAMLAAAPALVPAARRRSAVRAARYAGVRASRTLVTLCDLLSAVEANVEGPVRSRIKKEITAARQAIADATAYL